MNSFHITHVILSDLPAFRNSNAFETAPFVRGELICSIRRFLASLLLGYLLLALPYLFAAGSRDNIP
ncbi:hypothetical protein BDV12DRAFT_51932 [Aspergillus spectabilis]